MPRSHDDPVSINRVFHDHECHYYDERFAIVHDHRSADRARQEVEALLGRPLRAEETVLDVGCGTGWLAAGLRQSTPPVRATGIDLSAGMLARAREAGAWPLLQAQAELLPIGTGQVDLVVARGVLHHLTDPLVALREWRRVLRPGGAVVLSSEPTPAVERHGAVLVRALLALPVLGRDLEPEEEVWELAAMAANLHVFTLGELGDLAREAGFADVRLRSTGFAATLALTASYVIHGRAPAVARRLPWRGLEQAGRRADSVLWDRVIPSGQRHTVVGLLRG